jgi:hypothetical protein
LLRNEKWEWLTARTIAEFHAILGHAMPATGQRLLAAIYRALSRCASGALRPIGEPPPEPDPVSEEDHG